MIFIHKTELVDWLNLVSTRYFHKCKSDNTEWVHPERVVVKCQLSSLGEKFKKKHFI